VKRSIRFWKVTLAAVICLVGLVGLSPPAASGAAKTGAASVATQNRLIANVHSFMCLTVLGNLTANGSKVYQADCNNSPGQIWVYIATEVWGRWNLYNPHSGKCLDTTWNRTRAQMTIYECGNLPSLNENQLFYIVNDDEVQNIHPNWALNKCMGVSGGSLTPHAPVVFANCDGSPGQEWFWIDAR